MPKNTLKTEEVKGNPAEIKKNIYLKKCVHKKDCPWLSVQAFNLICNLIFK